MNSLEELRIRHMLNALKHQAMRRGLEIEWHSGDDSHWRLNNVVVFLDPERNFGLLEYRIEKSEESGDHTFVVIDIVHKVGLRTRSLFEVFKFVALRESWAAAYLADERNFP
jgi:hypothetical protein